MSPSRLGSKTAHESWPLTQLLSDMPSAIGTLTDLCVEASRLPLAGQPYLMPEHELIASAALLPPPPCISPSRRQHISRLSREPWLPGDPSPVWYVVDTFSSWRTRPGYSVPGRCLALRAGSHSTLNRWVIKYAYAPEFQKQFRHRQQPVGKSWRMDETYVKIKGKWSYLYRAVL